MRTFPYSIPVGDAVIEVLDENRFNILTEFCDFKTFWIPDTQDIASIVQVLQNPDWTEDGINAAVAVLEGQEAALEAKEWPTLAGTLCGDRHP